MDVECQTSIGGEQSKEMLDTWHQRLQNIVTEAPNYIPEFSTEANDLSNRLSNAYKAFELAFTKQLEISNELAEFATSYKYSNLSLENIEVAIAAVEQKRITNADLNPLLKKLREFNSQAVKTTQNELNTLFIQIETFCAEYNKARISLEPARHKKIELEKMYDTYLDHLNRISIAAKNNLLPDFSTTADDLSNKLKVSYQKACIEFDNYMETCRELARFSRTYGDRDLSLENIAQATALVERKVLNEPCWTGLLSRLKSFDMERFEATESQFYALVTETGYFIADYETACEKIRIKQDAIIKMRREIQLSLAKKKVEYREQLRHIESNAGDNMPKFSTKASKLICKLHHAIEQLDEAYFMTPFDEQAATNAGYNFDRLVTRIETFFAKYEQERDLQEKARQQKIREEQVQKTQALKQAINHTHQRMRQSGGCEIILAELERLEITTEQLDYVENTAVALSVIESIFARANTIPHGIGFRRVVEESTAILLQHYWNSQTHEDRHEVAHRLKQVDEILGHISSITFKTWMDYAKARFVWKNRYDIAGKVSEDPASDISRIRLPRFGDKDDCSSSLFTGFGHHFPVASWNEKKKRVEITQAWYPATFYWDPNTPDEIYNRVNIEQPRTWLYYAVNGLMLSFFTAGALTCLLICLTTALAIIGGIVTCSILLIACGVTASTSGPLALNIIGIMISSIGVGLILGMLGLLIGGLICTIPLIKGFDFTDAAINLYTDLFAKRNEQNQEMIIANFRQTENKDILLNIRVGRLLEQGMEGLKTLQTIGLIPENLTLEKAVEIDELMTLLMKSAETDHQAICDAARAPGEISGTYSPAYGLFSAAPKSQNSSPSMMLRKC